MNFSRAKSACLVSLETAPTPTNLVGFPTNPLDLTLAFEQTNEYQSRLSFIDVISCLENEWLLSTFS